MPGGKRDRAPELMRGQPAWRLNALRTAMSLAHRGLVLYHRAECLTHVGDSQAVRSLTQCGEPMRFAMAAPIDLRNDFDSESHCGASRRGPGTRPRAVVCWRWPRSTMVAAGRMRRGSAASVCRSFATGCCASTPADRTGWSMGSHRAHPRSSTPITGRTAEVVEAGPVPAVEASCAGGARTWRSGSWRRSPSRSTIGRELKALELRQDLGAAAPLRAKRARPRGF